MAESKSRISAAVPRGVQTFLFEEASARSAVAACLFDVIRGWSYDEVALPVFDFMEVFAEGGGEELMDKTFRFVDREGQLVALRSDFTPLVAKVVATRLERESGPFRLCYQGDVVRHEAPRAGAQSDFWQIGAELVGVGGLRGEAEILAVVTDALSAAGVDDLVVVLGHAGVVAELLASVAPERQREAREALDRRDEDALAVATEGLGHADAIRALPGLLGAPDVLSEASRVLGEPCAGILAELESLADVLERSQVPARITIDLADVRGTGYYTGMKFRLYAPGAGVALGGGGRYDDLIGRFGAPRKAVGFSLYLDRITHSLAQPPDGQPPAKTFAPGDGTDDLAASIRSAREARLGGSRVLLETSE